MLTAYVLSINEPLSQEASCLSRETGKYTATVIPHDKCYSKNCRKMRDGRRWITNPNLGGREEVDEEKVPSEGT